MFVLISKSVNNSELLKISSKSKIKPTDTPAEPIMCTGLNSLIWVNASYPIVTIKKIYKNDSLQGKLFGKCKPCQI